MRPLQDIRVLDLTLYLPGPYCSLLLADLGADVVKIEAPPVGDPMRWPPPQVVSGQSIFFAALNRNKRSLALNLKSEDGRRILKRLAARADVLLDGFRPGRLDKLGVGYAELSPANPRLVYCAITGYGQAGPDRDRAGHDIDFAAISGLLDVWRVRGGAPAVPPVQVVDMTAAFLAATGVLAALLARATTGRGQRVDVSLLESTWPWMVTLLPRCWRGDTAGAPGMEVLTGAVPCYNLYECADGRWLALGALEPQFWATFVERIGRPDLVDHAFDTGAAAETTIAAVRALIKTRPSAEWLARFAGADTCVEPVLTLAEAAADPRARESGEQLKVELPGGGAMLQVALPLKMDDLPAPRAEPPPDYGQHTVEVLRESGYTPEEIAGFRENGAIA